MPKEWSRVVVSHLRAGDRERSRPDRPVISKDEILNLAIALALSNDVGLFINTLG